MLDESKRKLYSRKYFEKLLNIVPYVEFNDLIYKEKDEHRDKIHTVEYWWIKYKMAKQYAKENECINTMVSLKDEKSKLKICDDYAAMITNSISHKEHLCDYTKQIIKNAILRDIYRTYTYRDSSLYHCVLTDSQFDVASYEFKNEKRIKSLLSSLNYYEMPIVSTLGYYLENDTLFSEGLSEKEQVILDDIINQNGFSSKKYKKCLALFEQYYKARKTKIDFDEAYKKYGSALFDFLYNPFSEMMPFDILLNYFVEKVLIVIRNYEEMFKEKIVSNQKDYWFYLKSKVKGYFNKSNQLEEDWWIDNNGGTLTSNISYVPLISMNTITSQIQSITAF